MKKNILFKKLIHIMISIFILLNILWMSNYMTYSNYAKSYEKIPKIYICKKDGYTLAVKKPNYLSFTGNFAVSNKDISYIIWPGLFMNGKYEHGLTIYDRNIDHGYMFYVNSELNYIDIDNNKFSDSEVDIINALLEKNNETLDIMRRLAIEEWGLN